MQESIEIKIRKEMETIGNTKIWEYWENSLIFFFLFLPSSTTSIQEHKF